jgi:hypothetical protein
MKKEEAAQKALDNMLVAEAAAELGVDYLAAADMHIRFAEGWAAVAGVLPTGDRAGIERVQLVGGPVEVVVQ